MKAYQHAVRKGIAFSAMAMPCTYSLRPSIDEITIKGYIIQIHFEVNYV